jgi:hypothetical protein
VDKNIWRKSYGSLPPLPCPKCGKAKLTRKGEIQRVEPAYITRELDEHGLQGDCSEGSFIAFMVCKGVLCGEVVAVSGDYRCDEHVQQVNDEEEQTFTTYNYRIYSMRPGPPLIEAPKKLNADAKRHLKKAFELFWTDSASCANRLRIVVEYLLDQFDIERDTAKGDPLNLASRIEKLTKTKPDQADYLNALRWLGNAGSHDGIVDFDDLLSCFDMLEHAMIELFEGRDEKRRAEAKRIIAAKGRPNGRK